MIEILFVLTFILLASGAIIGQKIDESIVDRPFNPVPLRIITSAAGFAAMAFFIWGFFPFKWWLPLLALIALPLGAAHIAGRSLRSYRAPLLGFIISLLGISLSVALVISVGA